MPAQAGSAPSAPHHQRVQRHHALGQYQQRVDVDTLDPVSGGGEAGGANDHFFVPGQASLSQMYLGAALTWLRPMWARAAGLSAQGFALLLTLVGITTIALGVGPQTPLDLVYHIAIVAVLIWGLAVTRRAGITVP